MQTLTVDEFKSVLAHEFGHYHAGDVALARGSTRRDRDRPDHRAALNNVLQRIFVAYGNLFSASRTQCRGVRSSSPTRSRPTPLAAAAIATGLRKVHGAAIAHQSYWATEVAPVVQSGHLASIAEGFSLYMRSPFVASSITALVAQAEAKRREASTNSSFVPRARRRSRPSCPKAQRKTRGRRRRCCKTLTRGNAGCSSRPAPTTPISRNSVVRGRNDRLRADVAPARHPPRRLARRLCDGERSCDPSRARAHRREHPEAAG